MEEQAEKGTLAGALCGASRTSTWARRVSPRPGSVTKRSPAASVLPSVPSASSARQ